MKISKALDMSTESLMKMKRADLSSAVSALSAAANKRIKRLEKNGMRTQALMGAERTGGAFSAKGKNLNELRAEYYRASAFLNAKTSTVKGAREVHKAMEERLGGKISWADAEKMWSAYNKLEEMEPNFLRLYGYAELQAYLRNEVVQGRSEKSGLLQKGLDRIENMYVEREESEDEMGEFFDI